MNGGNDPETTNKRIYFFDPDEGFDTIPDFTMNVTDYISRMINTGRPCDINGDGFNDLLIRRKPVPRASTIISIYYGGADFDTIPDDSITNPDLGRYFADNIYSGFDLNGDGCDEIIAYTGMDGRHIQFYLGGEPVDSIPRFYFQNETFIDRGYSISGYGFLSDVNNDGYDDWSLGVMNRNLDQDYPTWVFFGGDSLDAEPDRVLEFSGIMSWTAGSCRGGDINGDGYGDILELGSSYGTLNHLAGYLGSNWVDSSYIFAINPDNTRDLHEMRSTQGAYGDFNGDGAGDFCIVAKPQFLGPRMAIYAGNPDWEVSVFSPEGYPKTYKLITESYPNPFNSTTNVRFSLPGRGDLGITIFDLQGKRIEGATLNSVSGELNWRWDAGDRPSGVYILKATYKRRESSIETGTRLFLVK